MGKFRRKKNKKVHFGSHTYTGPTTHWGLVQGAGCNVYPFIKKKSGLLTIKTIDGRTWQVPRQYVQQRGV